MAVIDTIQDASKCYCLTGTAFERAVLYLLNQIAGGTMTLDEIQENSRCYCLTGVSYERAVLYLLSQIVAGGGGGGGGDPVDNQALGGANPPLVSSSKYILRDTDSGFMWYSATKAPPWSNI